MDRDGRAGRLQYVDDRRGARQRGDARDGSGEVSGVGIGRGRRDQQVRRRPATAGDGRGYDRRDMRHVPGLRQRRRGGGQRVTVVHPTGIDPGVQPHQDSFAQRERQPGDGVRRAKTPARKGPGEGVATRNRRPVGRPRDQGGEDPGDGAQVVERAAVARRRAPHAPVPVHVLVRRDGVGQVEQQGITHRA